MTLQTKFSSFQEAINTRKYCPFCKRKSGKHNKGLTIKSDYCKLTTLKLKPLLCKLVNGTASIQNNTIDHFTYAEIIIDPNSDNIIVKEDDPINYKIDEDYHYFNFNITCQKCHQYGYGLIVKVNFVSSKVESVNLAIESLSFEKDSVVYEIMNYYGFENMLTKTKYYNSDKKDSVFLPLVELNLNDPLSNFERVKNLVVFL